MDYDYIVVGAGAAGCVLAHRLSFRPDCKVLLIEAGPDTPPGAEPPDVVDPYPRSYAETDYMWPDLLVEMKDRGPDGGAPARRRYEQGRIVGGGGSLMGMMALRGMPGDYDEWRDLGAAGWSWRDVLPYFRKLERDMDFGGDLHGTEGPVPIRRVRDKTKWPALCRGLGQAIEADGYPYIEDLNSDFRDGNVAIPMSSTSSRRMSSGLAYLDAATRRRPNLRILAQTTVHGLLTEGRRVTGVIAQQDGRKTPFTARETVISAGSLHSPAILQRAGIGPGDLLQSLGIPVLANNPGVGENLHNHPIIYLAAHLKHQARQIGTHSPLTNNGFRYSSGLSGCPAGDMFMLFSNRSSWHAAGEQIGSIGISVYKSYSRGNVRISTADPIFEPNVRFRLLSDQRDLQRISAGFHTAWTLFHSPAVRPLLNEIFVPTAADVIRDLNRPRLSNAIKARIGALLLDAGDGMRRRMLESIGQDPAGLISDADRRRDFVYTYTGSMFHPIGTCRMGDPAERHTVVDPQCRVLGVDGLRVADGSVMPTMVRGNTNIPILMIAEKVADMMLADRQWM